MDAKQEVYLVRPNDVTRGTSDLPLLFTFSSN